jgi:hypothetical protein
MIARMGELWDRLRGRSARSDHPPAGPLSFRGVLREDALELTLALPFVLSSVPDTAREAAAAIHRYLAGLSPRDLVALDAEVRTVSWWSQEGSAWRSLSTRDVADLYDSGLHPAAVLGVASFHPNGRLRAAAVEQLGRVADGSELPFLLVRLNDWVAPVREAAYARMGGRLTPAYAPHLVRSLWLVTRLERCGRADHEALVARAMGVLRAPESRPALREGVHSPDRWLRRGCYGLLLETPGDDTREILEEALADEDALIRLWAAQRVDRFVAGEALRRIVDGLLRDPFMGARREGLRMLVGHFPDEAEADLRRALLDRHPTIREIARFDLRQRDMADFRGFYRAAAERAAGPELRAALAGLGETGTAEDAPLAERFLGNPLPGVRRAAVGALARLAPEASVPRFLDALRDRNAGVSRAGRLALAPHAGRVGAERLGTVAEEEGAATHVRIHALSLLAGLSKWEGIPWLVRACAAGDERVAGAARQHVRRWIDRFNRSFTKPTGPQLERMTAAIDQVGPALPREQERVMRFYMKGF